MFNHLSLIKNTTAYKIVKNEKKRDELSHAYLLVTKDAEYLREYLKVFVKLIECETEDFCDNCRKCRLIESEKLTDVKFYPEPDAKSILKETVDEITSESVVKAYEGGRKIFVIAGAEKMNLAAQNKLLKTLEEPPKNVIIILGTANESALLPTVKSRAERLEIPTFSNEDIFNALYTGTRREDLLAAINGGDRTVSKAEELFNQRDDTLNKFIADMLINLKTSKDVKKYELIAVKFNQSEFINKLKSVFFDIIKYNANLNDFANPKIIEGIKPVIKEFNDGAVTYILDVLTDAEKREKFNANDSILISYILFKILEGKYRWQKS